jgi:hypothetical protein
MLLNRNEYALMNNHPSGQRSPALESATGEGE